MLLKSVHANERQTMMKKNVTSMKKMIIFKDALQFWYLLC